MEIRKTNLYCPIVEDKIDIFSTGLNYEVKCTYYYVDKCQILGRRNLFGLDSDCRLFVETIDDDLSRLTP